MPVEMVWCTAYFDLQFGRRFLYMYLQIEWPEQNIILQSPFR